MKLANYVWSGVSGLENPATHVVLHGETVQRAGQYIVLAAGTFVFYRLFYELSLVLGQFVAVFPVSGVALALVFLYGYRLIPVFTLGLIGFTVSLHLPLTVVIGTAIGDAFAVFLSVYALKEIARFRPDIGRLQDVQGMLFFGVLVYAFVLFSFGLMSFWLGGIYPFVRYAAPFKIAVFSIVLGIVLFSPLVFSWYRSRAVRQYAHRAPEFIVASVAMIGSTAFSFAYFHEYRFVAFVFMIWVALRFPMRAVSIINLLTAMATLVGLLFTYPGHSGMTALAANTSYFQLFFTSVVVSSLIITAMKEEMITSKNRLLRAGEELKIQVKHRTASLTQVNQELMREISRRRLIESELRESEDRFRLITEHARDMICIIDGNEKLVYINRSIGSMLGWETSEFLRKPVRTMIHPDDIADVRQWSDLKLKQMRLKKKSGTYIWSEAEFYPVLLKGHPFTVMMARDISARKALEQRKDEFLSIASHELRTPLTSIKGYTQILERMVRESENPKTVLYAQKIDTHIDKLNMLISDLLDVSKIQAGRLQFRFEPIDFHKFVTECVSNARLATNTHEITHSGKTSEMILGDRQRLEQVFSNLLSNAIKYSPGAGKVLVQTGVENSHVRLSVTDYGIGIPKTKLEKIFERYYRVDGTAEHFSGLGIGLYITEEIIHRHNGSIAVRSEEGKGSTFTCLIPVMK